MTTEIKHSRGLDLRGINQPSAISEKLVWSVSASLERAYSLKLKALHLWPLDAAAPGRARPPQSGSVPLLWGSLAPMEGDSP